MVFCLLGGSLLETGILQKVGTGLEFLCPVSTVVSSGVLLKGTAPDAGAAGTALHGGMEASLCTDSMLNSQTLPPMPRRLAVEGESRSWTVHESHGSLLRARVEAVCRAMRQNVPPRSSGLIPEKAPGRALPSRHSLHERDRVAARPGL